MKHTKYFKLLTMSALAIGLQSIAVAADQAWVRLSDDGSRVLVDAEGITELSGVSSAVYQFDGAKERVGTRGSKLIGSVNETSGTTPFGDAVISTATFGKGQFHYTLKLKRLDNLRAFTLQAVFHNRSDQDVTLDAFDLLDTNKGPGGSFKVANADDWLVTPLMQDSPALTLNEINKGLGEAAMIYNADGHGFLVGPVGPAEAYTQVEVRNQMIKAYVQMDGVLVRAGESRRSEEMIFSFEPSTTSTDIWTRWVATTHGVRRSKGAVYGWCSWYDRTTKIDAAHVLDVTEIIESNPNTFGQGIIQIDDGYQKMDGDWSANAKFPEGMAAIAKRIRESGNIPGVWFAPLMINPEHPWGIENPDAIQTNAKGIANFMNANPFHPEGANWINPDHPKSKEFLFNIINDARERGFGYIKIDFNGIGNRFVDPTKTRLQIFRELYTLYREAAGEEMYILSCLGAPTRGVIGFIDAARVGPDSHPAHFKKCLKSVLRFQIYDNVWWQNDADVAYLAQTLPSRTLGPTPQGEGMWQTWHNVVGLVGGTAMTSEPLNKPDAIEQWRNFEIMRPGSREPAKLLTLGQTPNNEIFGFAAQRPYGDFAVYNLYNSTEEKMAVTLDFKAAGLPVGTKCAVFDFWSNKLVGYAQDSYTTAELDSLSSSLLRFTPIVASQVGLPILIGSNLHLSIGATEIDNIRVSASSVEIDLSDAGAQEGSLTFYSKQALKAAGSENCEIVSVKDLGDNLWQVNLAGRQWGTAQSFSLSVAH
jgi:alpha-galactosidase